MKKLIILFVIFYTFLGCDSDTTDSPQLFKQLSSFKILSINKGDERLNFSLLLDQGGNQLYFYDINQDCYFDFEELLPGKNGLILPSNPKMIELSSDNRKIAILTTDNTISIINIDPLIDYYKDGCFQKTFPYIESQTKLDVSPDFIKFSKNIESLYSLELISFKNKTIYQYIYSEMVLALLDRLEFSNEITAVLSIDNKIYLAQKGVSEISVIENGILMEDRISFGELPETINISKFLIDENHLYLYQKESSTLYIWNIDSSKFESIAGNIDPLDDISDPFMEKKTVFEYPIYDMKIINHTIDIKDGEYLNSTGYLDTHQLPNGKYLAITDTSGYITFITISTDFSNITSYPEDYDSIDAYKTALEGRFKKFKQPLQTDYTVKVTYLTQSTVCTQFNKREANGCFSPIQTEVLYDAEQYVKLNNSVEDGDYYLKNETLFFKYQGAIENSLSNDGSFSDSQTIQSTTVDFDKFNINPSETLLQIISPLTDEKIVDSKCSQYATTDLLFIPINSISAHTLTLNVDNFANLSYCFDTAITFQLRAKDGYTLYGSKTGFISFVPFCTNEPLVYQNRVSCELDDAYYENSLFGVKLFSDKEDIEVDSTISFYLGVSSESYKYRHSMIAPIELDSVIRKIDDKNETTIFVLDTSRNRVIEIKLTELDTVETILQ
ncbi:hypothetical protein JXR93_00160 [bacterium]|nr:hypothetical protein [bacterium]